MRKIELPPRPSISPEMEFFIFLLQQYAAYKQTTGDKVLKIWDEHGVTEWILKNYWGYHSEAIENAFKDIDSMLATGKPAW